VQSLLHFLSENGLIFAAIVLFVAVAVGIIKWGVNSIGKIIGAFFLLLIVVQCMLGKITSDEAAKKTKDELNPLGVLDEAQQIAKDRGQKRQNQCLKDKAVEYKLAMFLPYCAGITGPEYESCAKLKVFGTNPDAWALAQIRCGLGGTQGRLDDQAVGLGIAMARKIMRCPGSEAAVCAKKSDAERAAEAAKLAAESKKRADCLEGAVGNSQLVEQSRRCYALQTRAEWEVCMNRLLCPLPAANNGCAWVNFCQQP
jgi:hypothetical protein